MFRASANVRNREHRGYQWFNFTILNMINCCLYIRASISYMMPLIGYFMARRHVRAGCLIICLVQVCEIYFIQRDVRIRFRFGFIYCLCFIFVMVVFRVLPNVRVRIQVTAYAPIQ